MAFPRRLAKSATSSGGIGDASKNGPGSLKVVPKTSSAEEQDASVRIVLRRARRTSGSRSVQGISDDEAMSEALSWR